MKWGWQKNRPHFFCSLLAIPFLPRYNLNKSLFLQNLNKNI